MIVRIHVIALEQQNHFINCYQPIIIFFKNLYYKIHFVFNGSAVNYFAIFFLSSDDLSLLPFASYRFARTSIVDLCSGSNFNTSS